MLFGYLLGFLIVPRLITQERFPELPCICGVILTLMAFLTTGYVSIRCIALLDAANAMNTNALSYCGAAPWTPMTSALIVMAYSGGSIMPKLYVALKSLVGFQTSFALLVIPSYLAVFFYARHYGRTGLLPLDQIQ